MSWLRVRSPRPAPRQRLLCFAYAGGGATTFHPWHEAFGPEVEVAAVQLPGRQERLSEPALTSTRGMVDAVLAALTALAAARPAPLAILGVSFGGQLAWDLAARLVDRGQTTRLFLLASRAPQLPPRRPLLSDLGDTAFIRELGVRYGTSMAMFQDTGLWELAGPPLRGDIRAMETRAHPERLLPVPATILRGAADPSTAEQSAAAWAGALSGPIEEHIVPGGHFFVDTHRAIVLDRIGEALKAG